MIIVTADLGFGDSGKGTIVDYLTRRYQAATVVRYNGGAQAAHNVVTADGRHHTFAQFGAGSFAGAGTHLSRFMILNPLSLVEEGLALQGLGEADIFARLTVDERALVTTPYHQAVNRLREIARGGGKHGSCGMGVGETMSDFVTHGERVLLAGDLHDRRATIRKLGFLRELKRGHAAPLELPDTAEVRAELKLLDGEDAVAEIADAYEQIVSLFRIVPGDHLAALAEQGPLIFEGAQGVLLDEWFGFHPYTTWSTTTFENADMLLDEIGRGAEGFRLGILRAYLTRHGAGPFVTEDAEVGETIPDLHNGTGRWQDDFRIGHFDAVAVRYALDVCGGVDALAVTGLDRLEQFPALKVCTSYGDKEPGIYEDGRLLVGVKDELERQERMTRFLETVQPRYTLAPAVGDGYAGHLGRELGVPVAISSYGVAAEDKRQLRPLIRAAAPVARAA